MTTLGAVFRPQNPPERLRGTVRAAEEAGLDELWLWEDCFCEGGIASAAAALAWTEHLRVGVGLLPVPLRNVALAAMETATLYRMFPDRVRIGVGHGVLDWMAQAGARVESPMTLLREYLVALRALLRGDHVTSSGRYVRLDGVALDWPPATPPAILAGATGPRTIRLSGELADGTILVAGTTPDEISEARRLVDQGRAVGGRVDAHTIVVYLEVEPGADPRSVTDRVRSCVDAGADSVVIQPAAEEPDPEAFVRFVAGLEIRRG